MLTGERTAWKLYFAPVGIEVGVFRTISSALPIRSVRFNTRSNACLLQRAGFRVFGCFHGGIGLLALCQTALIAQATRVVITRVCCCSSKSPG